jgi:hypothetical protein
MPQYPLAEPGSRIQSVGGQQSALTVHGPPEGMHGPSSGGCVQRSVPAASGTHTPPQQSYVAEQMSPSIVHSVEGKQRGTPMVSSWQAPELAPVAPQHAAFFDETAQAYSL